MMQPALPILVSILLALAGLLLVILARRNQYQEQVMSRLYVHEIQESPAPLRRLSRSALWKTLLRRAGLEPRLSTSIGVLAGVLAAAVFGFVLAGAPGLAVSVLLALLGVVLAGFIAVKRHQGRLLNELPSFLDQIIRSLKTGNSLAGAFRESANETSGALAPVMRQAVRYMDLGYDVGEALTETARVHRLRELGILALAVRVNTHYGGSAVEILQSLIDLVHRRERLRRQLRALTSETRFSAIVLVAMPLLIGGYMMAINPGYILTMWEHDSGGWIMIGALGWQVLGMLLLWRMVRSIG